MAIDSIEKGKYRAEDIQKFLDSGKTPKIIEVGGVEYQAFYRDNYINQEMIYFHKDGSHLGNKTTHWFGGFDHEAIIERLLTGYVFDVIYDYG